MNHEKSMPADEMQTDAVRSRWLRMLAGGAVRVDPQDIHREAIHNLWMFSPTDEETRPLQVDARVLP